MTPDEFDKWRIMPRILMVAYYSFFMYAFVWVTEWFMSYNFNTISDGAVALAIAGFPAAILGVLSGVLASLSKNYFMSGGKSGNGNGG